MTELLTNFLALGIIKRTSERGTVHAEATVVATRHFGTIEGQYLVVRQDA